MNTTSPANPGGINLPNYFLADLPAEAVITPGMISEACLALKRNRLAYLANRSTQSLVEALSAIALNWLEPDYPFRKLALEFGPTATGFSRATIAKGLDACFRHLTPEQFNALLVQELGNAKRLDRFMPDNAASSRASMAVGPELMVHVAAGLVPNPTVTSLVLGLLTRSAQFLKCPSLPGADFLPRLFAHSLYEAQPKLGACLELARWTGGNTDLEAELFSAADLVTATGNDETLEAIRHRVSTRTRFLGHGHRVSFAYLAGGALSGSGARRAAELTATDVVAWNQLGCLSPHVVYVESGALKAEQFAEWLAEELARREETEPRGELPSETAAAIASRRAIYQVRAAHSPETRFWQSPSSTAWTVVYESDPRFQLSCLNRFVYVKAVENLTIALQNAESVRGKVSSVGLAAPEETARQLTTELARWGVTRVCPIGEMQNPPLTWRHDGRPALGDLVTWIDWEAE